MTAFTQDQWIIVALVFVLGMLLGVFLTAGGRKKWKTRLELSNAIFDYIEIFYNRQRRHSSLGYRTPIEHELLSEKTPQPA